MGFSEVSKVFLPDHNAQGRHFVHEESGCTIYHVQNDDRENLFAFIFNTPQQNSRGTAHILEHTVLCGSERFLVRDPFAQLLKGSMHTYLNAMTYPDRTIYPAASAVEKDLFNILKVYGDAVFFPLLKQEMFLQEGIRIEFPDKAPAMFQGVVYNEMMGNVFNKEYIISTKSFSSVFESGTYSYESGGDPDEIPFLSYEDFLAYHRRYYCLANCCIFLYGNIPSEKYLQVLEEEIFSRIQDSGNPIAPYDPVSRWKQPKHLRIPYPSTQEQEGENRESVLMNWLLSPTKDISRILSLQLVSELLMGNKAAPLYRALIESGIGENLSSSSGLELDAYESVFSVGMDGMHVGREKEMEDFILYTLTDITKSGVATTQMEAVFRKLEFAIREVEGGARNGMKLLRRISRAWSYGVNLNSVLNLSSYLQDVRDNTKKDHVYLLSLITKELLQNTHRTTIAFYPDTKLQSKKMHQRETQLRNIIQSSQKEQAYSDFHTFLRMQESCDSPADLSCIPRLKRDDIPHKVRTFLHEEFYIADTIPVMLHPLFTNDIAYISFAFDLQGLSDELFDLLPLFSEVLTECGLRTMHYTQLANEIDLYTGGVFSRVDNETMKEDTSCIRPVFYVHFSFVQSNSYHAIRLLFRILQEADFFQIERLQVIHLEHFHMMSSSLVHDGHRFAYYRAAQSLSTAADLAERWDGLRQLYLLHALKSKNYENLAERFSTIAKKLFVKNRLSISVVCPRKRKKDIITLLSDEIASLPLGEKMRAPRGYQRIIEKRTRHEAILTHSSVSYNAIAFPALSVLSPQYSAQRILAHLLDNEYFWEKLRTRGGAYSFATLIRTYEGVMAMISYRDPHIGETFQVFKDSLEYFSTHLCSPENIDLALFSIVGKEERTFVPSEQGNIQFRYYLYNIDTEFRQYLRDALLHVTPKDVQRVAQMLLQHIQSGHMVTVTNEILLKQETVPRELRQHILHLPF